MGAICKDDHYLPICIWGELPSGIRETHLYVCEYLYLYSNCLGVCIWTYVKICMCVNLFEKYVFMCGMPTRDIYICICMYIRISVHKNADIESESQVYILAHLHLFAHTYTHMCTYHMCIYIYTQLFTYIHIHISTYPQRSTYILIHTYIPRHLWGILTCKNQHL